MEGARGGANAHPHLSSRVNTERTGTSPLLAFLKDAPRDLVFDGEVFGSGAPSRLWKTSKSVRKLLQDRYQKNECFSVDVIVHPTACYASVLRGVHGLGTWCRLAGFHWTGNHDISHAFIGNTRVPELTNALTDAGNLTVLTLNNHYIGSLGMQSLNAKLFSNCLVMLDLGSNLIGAHGMQTLADALEPVSSLVTLRLETNEIESDGVFSLAKTISNQQHLTLLDLSNNHIKCEGVGYLSDALRSCSSLTELILKENLIRTSGVEILSTVMQESFCLQNLDVSFNIIGETNQQSDKTALDYLIEGVTQCESLTQLNIACNGLAYMGSQTLMSEMHNLSTLKTLIISNNVIPAREQKLLYYLQPMSTDIIF